MKKQILISVLCAAAFFSCGTVRHSAPSRVSASKEPVPEDYSGHMAAYYHSEGIKAYLVREEAGEAADYFRRALAEDSLYAPSYAALAEIEFTSDPLKALELSRHASVIDTANLTYKSQYARALIANDKYDEALDVYSVLMREDSHNPLNYSLLAALYDYNKQPFTAIAILDSAEYKLGRIEELSAYKRQLLINVRLYDKAIEESKALVAEYPYDEENYLVLADLYAAMGKDSLAVANYREALMIDSTNVYTLLSVAAFYKSRNNDRSYLGFTKRVFESDALPVEQKVEIFHEITASLDYYRRNFFAINSLASALLIKYPHDYSIVDLYSTHLIRSGETLAALDIYKSYMQINPDSLRPYYAVLDIEGYLQRPDSVARYSDVALRRFPDNIELYLRKGFALDNLNQPVQAIKTYRQALRRAGGDSTRSVVMGVIGDTYHKMGDHRNSFKSYDKALRYDPDNNVVLNNYAYYLSELDRDMEKALSMSTRANELSPGNPTYLDTQGWIFYKMKNYEEAKKLILQAVSLDRTGSPVLLLHYGDILYELGDHFMAKIYWRRALEKGHDEAEIQERLKRLEQ